ncbi:MAG TPA: hypothetical protein PKD10_18410 [Paracoccaceae bacterium]|nr:hypothetical protein [Paracoccaceae bacterium]HMO71101.1 hypothetical protein [Paracoccaceae bacterium]
MKPPPKPRPVSAQAKLAAQEADIAQLQSKLDALAVQVRTLSDTLTQPGPGGAPSLVEMWRAHALREMAMDYLTRRLRGALAWAAALAGALGLALALKALGWWPPNGSEGGGGR